MSNNVLGAADNHYFHRLPKLLRRARRDQRPEDFRLAAITPEFAIGTANGNFQPAVCPQPLISELKYDLEMGK